jgi:hypothetical protein
VSNNPTNDDTDFYTNLAATLHGIADDIATLAGRGLPDRAYVGITVMPLPHDLPDDVMVRAVDSIGQALAGKPGTTERMSSGSYHHNAGGTRGGNYGSGGVDIRVFQSVTPPDKRALRDEIERLTAERDRLAAQVQQPEQPEATS